VAEATPAPLANGSEIMDTDIIDPDADNAQPQWDGTEPAVPLPTAGGHSKCWGAFVESVGSLAGICTTAAFLPQVYAVHITGDTSGLSLPMYCIFVSGVFMWMLYGVLKGAGSLVLANLITFVLAGYILSAIIENVFFHSQKEKELDNVLLDAADTATRVMPMVAVCATGPAHTFTHPRVRDGLEKILLQPGFDLFAALDMRAPLVDATRDEHSVASDPQLPKRHAALVAPSRMQASLSSLAALDAVLYDDTWSAVPPAECRVLDETAPAVGAAVASLAFGLQQCHSMVLRAEHRRNLTYTHIVRVRPDLLWTRPLPPPSQWSTTSVLLPADGAEHLAIIPRAAAASLRVYDLLRGGCPRFQSGATVQHLSAGDDPNASSAVGSRSGGSDTGRSASNVTSGGASALGGEPTSSESDRSRGGAARSAATSNRSRSGDSVQGAGGAACPSGLGVACLFRTRLAIAHGVSNDHYGNGEPVRAPRIGVLCSKAGARDAKGGECL